MQIIKKLLNIFLSIYIILFFIFIFVMNNLFNHATYKEENFHLTSLSLMETTFPIYKERYNIEDNFSMAGNDHVGIRYVPEFPFAIGAVMRTKQLDNNCSNYNDIYFCKETDAMLFFQKNNNEYAGIMILDQENAQKREDISDYEICLLMYKQFERILKDDKKLTCDIIDSISGIKNGK